VASDRKRRETGEERGDLGRLKKRQKGQFTARGGRGRIEGVDSNESLDERKEEGLHEGERREAID